MSDNPAVDVVYDWIKTFSLRGIGMPEYNLPGAPDELEHFLEYLESTGKISKLDRIVNFWYPSFCIDDPVHCEAYQNLTQSAKSALFHLSISYTNEELGVAEPELSMTVIPELATLEKLGLAERETYTMVFWRTT